MSTGRLKNQKDFDLEQMVKIIDTALESNDPRIKDALRALMTITVLCTAEDPDGAMRYGPLARVIEDNQNLNRRLSALEQDVAQMKFNMPKQTPYTPPSGPGGPWGPYVGTPNTNPWTGTNPNGPKPTWGSTWSAGDDPNYKGANASTTAKLAEDFIRELERK